MEKKLTDKLLNEALISPAEKELEDGGRPLSLHWDLRAVLYLGILLVTSASGILIYQNIDTIGHGALMMLMAISTIVCFFWACKHAPGFHTGKVESESIWQDYVILLGSLLILSLVGYAQFQYNFFGNRWGLALFIPMMILFAAAYYFDHLGILSLAITNLAAWAGIAITPSRLLRQNDFHEEKIMITGLILGTFLISISYLSRFKDFKKHFAFTYKNFGIHLFFVSLLSLLFYYERFYLLIFLFLVLAALHLYASSIKEGSYYFLVTTILYFYVGLSYVFIQLTSFESVAAVYIVFVYFILSGIGLISFLMHLSHKIKLRS